MGLVGLSILYLTKLLFISRTGIQVGTSDPVFMQSQGTILEGDQQSPYGGHEYSKIPYPFDPVACDSAREAGDEFHTSLKTLGRNWSRQIHSGLFRTWDEIAFVRKHWEGPLVLKGILHVEDAVKAMEAGCDGVVVSNHGGRQVDGAIPALIALEKVCKFIKSLIDVDPVFRFVEIRGFEKPKQKENLRSCLIQESGGVPIS